MKETESLRVEATGAPYKMLIPSLEDAMAIYDPPEAAFCRGWNPLREIVAIGTAVYDNVRPTAYDAHRMMHVQDGEEGWSAGGLVLLA